MEKISLSISCYNNVNFLEENIKNIHNNDKISEIIICDDCSTKEQYDLLVSLSQKYNKIKVFRNSKNLGAYYNKLENS